MGIEDLPEIQKLIAEFGEKTIRELLQRRVTDGVKPDRRHVERLYRRSAKEWKVKSLLFEKEEHARTFAADVASGTSFDAAAEKAAGEGKAIGAKPAEFYPRGAMMPQVVEALLSIEKGAVTTPIQVTGGFTVIRVEDERYPENARLRTKAESESLAFNKQRALKRYYAKLLARYTGTDQALLKQLDFESPRPGLAALRKDRRVVTRIRGGADVTVADLTRALEERFFHGVGGAIRKRQVNAQKADALDALVSSKIVPMEARRLRIHQTTAFRKAVDRYRESVVFSQFVSRVVAPGVKIGEGEARRYYDAHKSEFTLPTFYKLESLGYRDVERAQSGLAKLRSGTDVKWLKANADDLLKPGESEIDFSGATVAASTMPPALRAVLAGTKKGDYRLFATEGGQAHVIHVRDVTAPGEEPFDEAKDRIEQHLLQERVTAALKEWVAKLRQARPVKVYLTRVGA